MVIDDFNMLYTINLFRRTDKSKTHITPSIRTSHETNQTRTLKVNMMSNVSSRFMMQGRQLCVPNVCTRISIDTLTLVKRSSNANNRSRAGNHNKRGRVN